MSEQDWLQKDFYATLGVSKDADEAEIKKQYRKLARKYHPDQNDGDPVAEAKFKEVGEAYSVLSNSEQRQRYDALRSMAGGGPRFSAGPGGNGGPAFEDMFGGMFGGGVPRSGGPAAGGGGGFEDILSGLFGGGGRGGFAQAGADISARADLSFADAVKGSTLALKVGGKSIKTKVPAGVRDGQKIRLRGKGHPGSHGGPPGDLIVQVAIAAHPVFELSGKDVIVNLPITFSEAAMGATVAVPTVSGESVKVKIPAGSEAGKVLRVRGRGIDDGKTKGDLLVRIAIAVPKRLSRSAKQALKDFAEATAEESPRGDLFEQARL